LKYNIEAIEWSVDFLIEKYNSNNGLYADIVWSFSNDYRQAVVDESPKKDKALYIIHNMSQGLAINFKTLIWYDMFVTSSEIENCWRNGGPILPILKEIPNALLDRGFRMPDVLGAVKYTGYENHMVDEYHIKNVVDFFFEERDHEIENDHAIYVDELKEYYLFLMCVLNEPEDQNARNQPALVFLCTLLLSGQIRNFIDLVKCGIFYDAHLEERTPFYAVFNGQSIIGLDSALMEKAINPFERIDENITKCVNELRNLTLDNYKNGVWKKEYMCVSEEELLAVQGTPVVVPFEIQ